MVCMNGSLRDPKIIKKDNASTQKAIKAGIAITATKDISRPATPLSSITTSIIPDRSFKQLSFSARLESIIHFSSSDSTNTILFSTPTVLQDTCDFTANTSVGSRYLKRKWTIVNGETKPAEDKAIVFLDDYSIQRYLSGILSSSSLQMNIKVLNLYYQKSVTVLGTV